MVITLSFAEVQEAITQWIEKRNLRPADPKTIPVQDSAVGSIGPVRAFQFKVEAIEVKDGPYRS